MFVFLAIFIVFLLYINFLMHKNKRAQENLEKQFWDRERSANFTRKKDISNLNYLIITEDKIPQNLTTDAKKSLETLCGQKQRHSIVKIARWSFQKGWLHFMLLCGMVG